MNEATRLKARRRLEWLKNYLFLSYRDLGRLLGTSRTYPHLVLENKSELSPKTAHLIDFYILTVDGQFEEWYGYPRKEASMQRCKPSMIRVRREMVDKLLAYYLEQ